MFLGNVWILVLMSFFAISTLVLAAVGWDSKLASRVTKIRYSGHLRNCLQLTSLDCSISAFLLGWGGNESHDISLSIMILTGESQIIKCLCVSYRPLFRMRLIYILDVSILRGLVAVIHIWCHHLRTYCDTSKSDSQYTQNEEAAANSHGSAITWW